MQYRQGSRRTLRYTLTLTWILVLVLTLIRIQLVILVQSRILMLTHYRVQGGLRRG